MTIEIRELVIEARVTDVGEMASSSLSHRVAKNKEEQAYLVTLINQRVLELLREERGRGVL